MGLWRSVRSGHRAREARGGRHTARRLKPRARLDIALLTVLGGLVAGLLAIFATVVMVAEPDGTFDRPLIRPLPDHRLLVNLRDDLADRPLRAAAHHAAEDAVYLAQAGGAVHRYHTGTGVWRTDRPFDAAAGPGFSIAGLRAGCGVDPQADDRRCAAPDTLWALGEDDTLAYARGGDWRIVLGGSRFVGNDGRPVDGADLTAAAVGPDGSWLAFGTSGQGAGVFDRGLGVWLAVDNHGALPDPSVTALRPGADGTWTGTAGGLAYLRVADGAAVVAPVASAAGRVDDLAAIGPAGVVAMLSPRCRDSVGLCTRLLRYADPLSPPEVLIDEFGRYDALALSALGFADLHGGNPMVAGAAGAYRYDADRRAWRRLDPRPVTTAWAERPGHSFLYAVPGEVGRITGGVRGEPRWVLAPEAGRVTALLPGPGGIPLALLEQGALLSLQSTGRAAPAWTPQRTGVDFTSFRRAVAVGDDIVLAGPDGAVAHDVVTRRHERLTGPGAAPWLWQPGTPLVAAGRTVYGLERDGGDLVARWLDLTAPDREATTVGDPRIAAPPGRPEDWPVHAWGALGLSAIDADGRAHLLSRGVARPLTGGPAAALADAEWRDVAIVDDDLLVATDRGLWGYTATGRAWSGPFGAAVDDGDFRSLAVTEDRLLVVTGRGRLADAAAGEVLIGGGEAVGTIAATASDARRRGDALYLAGAGMVARYGLSQRSVEALWDVPGAGAVRIVDVVDGLPLTLSGGRLALGGEAMSDGADPVVAASVGNGDIWAVRQASGHRYLEAAPLADPFDEAQRRCLFRSPTAGSGSTVIVDAVPLADDRIAVLTDAGLAVYDAAARSWRRGPDWPVGDGDRLAVLGDRLVHVGGRPGARRFAHLPLAALVPASGCATEPLSPPVSAETVAEIAVDAATGTAALLTGDGAVVLWRDGRAVTLLHGPAGAPPSESLRSVTADGRDLLITADDGLWRYQPRSGRWSSVALTIGMAALQSVADVWRDIVLEPADDGFSVTAVDADGTVFTGRLAPRAATVSLSPLPSTVVPSLGQPAEALVDVADLGDGHWSFLLTDRLRRLDPATRRWAPDIVFPDASGDLRLGRLAGRLVVESPSAWWPIDENGPRRIARPEGEATALTADGSVIRLRGSGAVLRCAGDGGSCDVLVGAAMPLDPDTVSAAYWWAGHFVLATRTGLRIYDPAARQEVAGTAAAARITATPRQVVTAAGRLWLLSPAGDVVAIDRSGRARWVADDADALAVDEGGAPWIVAGDGEARRWDGIRFVPTATPAPTGPIPGGMVPPDTWPRLSRLVAERPDGRPAFDPVTGLAGGSDGPLWAVTAGSRLPLADRAGTEPAPPDPLDAGWLRWHRTDRTFTVATPDGPARLPADRVVVDGRLAFGAPGRLVVAEDGRFHLATADGVTTFADGTLSLTDPATTFAPVSFGAEPGAAHGRFHGPAGAMPYGGAAIAEDTGVVETTAGDVVFREDVAAGTLAVAVSVSGEREPASATRGFAWDRRRGLAWGPDGLSIQTDTGIVAVGRLAGFDAGPGRAALAGGRLTGGPLTGDGTPMLQVGDAWFARREDGWQPTSPPGEAPDIRLTDARWTWTRQNGRIDVSHTATDAPILASGDAGIGFLTDRLRAAGAYGDRLVIVTEALLEVAGPDGPTEFASPSPPDTDDLRTVPSPDGETLYAVGPDGGVLAFDDATNGFAPVADGEPLHQGRLVDLPHFRIDRDGGRLAFSVRLTDPATGRQHWAPMTADAEGLPLDRATAVAATPGHLYVGTPVGLAVYRAGARAGLDDLVALHDLGGAPVNAIGAASGDHGALIAHAGARCIVLDGAAASPCPASLSAADPGRGETRFWRWRTTPDGTPVGRYLDAGGNAIGAPIRMTGGRLPHDRIADLVACGETTAVLWRNRRITLHGPLSLSVDGDTATYDVAAQRPERLFCLRRAIGDPAVPAGPYAVLPGGGLLGFDGSAWRPVAADAAAAIAARRDGTVIYDRARLRLLRGDAASLRFQYRDTADTWRDLAWDGDRPAIDTVHHALSWGGRLWLATGGGLVAVEPRAGSFALSPDRVTIVDALWRNGAGCRVTDWTVGGGSTVLRCADEPGRAYGVDPDEAADGETGAITPLADDPFADATLVDAAADHPWTWRRLAPPGEAPRLAVTFHGEPAALTGGRFGFDDIRGIAAPDRDTLHVATAAGWYRMAADATGLMAFRRPEPAPVDPASVVAVSAMRRDGETILCLTGTAGGGTLIDPAGEPATVDACAGHLGHDGLWSYESSPDGLAIGAIGLAGRIGHRTMTNGRFDDRRAIAMPVPTEAADGGIRVDLPTPAGIVRYGGDMQRQGVLFPPFDGLADGAVPRAMVVLAGTAMLPAGDRLVPVEGGGPDGGPLLCPALGRLGERLAAEGAVLTGLTRGPGATLRAQWHERSAGRTGRTGRTGWATLSCQGRGTVAVGTHPIPVADWPRFRRHYAAWGAPAPLLALTAFGDRLAVTGGGDFLPISAGRPIEPIADAVAGHQAIIVAPDEVWLIDLNAAMMALFATRGE